MKTSSLFLAMALTASAVMAQNRVNLTLAGGETDSYTTSELESIEIDGYNVTVNPLTGAAATYKGTVSNISFVRNTDGHVTIAEAGGWFETSYVKWLPFAGATNYQVYIKGGEYSDWTRLDYQLVRNYGTYGRADMPGLKAGSYTMKVVPVVNGTADESAAAETAPLAVKAHDRGGFAHFNYPQGVGAYNNDGTLKTGAKVFYVTAETAKTISTAVVTGKSAETVTGMQNIIYAYQKGLDTTPLCFRIIGRVTADDMDPLLSSAEGLQIKGKNEYSEMNITIEGIGDDAVIHSFGMLIRNCSSVEVRNLAIMYFMDDGISFDTANSHCWVHNIDFFYGMPGGDSDQAKGDGTVDLKGDSQYLTISYNHFWDSGKASLCGMKSETGPNWITYHHNWFDHSDSRMPRIRTMSVHVYNNYFDGVSKYGTGVTTGADAFVERNYYRDCKYPMLSSLQGSDIMGEGSTPNGKGTFSSETGGSIKAYGNIMRGWYFYRPWSETNTVEFDCYETATRDEKVPANVISKSGSDTYSNWDTNPATMYDYTPDDAADVQAIVTGVYGAGRMGHGDFKWRFNNNIQDKNYDVITELSDAIKSYRNSLVGFYEGSKSFGDADMTFRTTMGDATAGSEFPFGDGNFAQGGGSSNPPVVGPVEAGGVFMASADGTDYLWMNADNADAVNTFIADGTITLDESSSFDPAFANSTYPKYTGAIKLGTSTGTMTIKCPSISKFKLQLLRTGSYKGSVEMSTDGGATFTTVSTFNQSKGNVELDLSAAVSSATPVIIRVNNTSTGNLNVHGIYILKAAE